MPGPSPARRVPTEDQARLVAERAKMILEAWAAQGLPPLSALEVGPVRLEFAAAKGNDAPAAEGEKWRGKAFG